MACSGHLSVSQPPKNLVAQSFTHLMLISEKQASANHFRDIFDILKEPIFWKSLERPWSRQKWTYLKNGHNRS